MPYNNEATKSSIAGINLNIKQLLTLLTEEELSLYHQNADRKRCGRTVKVAPEGKYTKTLCLRCSE